MTPLALFSFLAAACASRISSVEESGRAVRAAAWTGRILRGRYRLEELQDEGWYYPFSYRRKAPKRWPSGKFPYSSHLSPQSFSEPKVLGKGSYGDAWRAFDLERNISVVVKIPRTSRNVYVTPEVAKYDADAREELERSEEECKFVQRMVKEDGAYPAGKAHLCRCLASHVSGQEDPDDVAFLVLEDCGEPVRLFLKWNWRRRDNGEQTEEEEEVYLANVRYWMNGTLAAVRFMSGLEKPMLHMDIHWDNVVIGKDQEARLIDFGFTQPYDWRFPDVYHTRSPPEHAWTRGGWMREYPKDKAWSYDVWSIGALYSELICNRESHPFQTRDAERRFPFHGCRIGGGDGVGSSEDWKVIQGAVAPYEQRLSPERLMDIFPAIQEK